MHPEIGPWRLEAELGAGGMGRVFRAHRRDDPAAVAAIKLLHTPAATHRGALAREVRLLAGLQHPDIVALVDHDLAAPVPWVALSWIEGVPLGRWAQHTGSGLSRPSAAVASTLLPPQPAFDGEQTLAWESFAAPAAASVPSAGGPVLLRAGALQATLDLLVQVCTPLAWLHGEGQVHLDLKPANVLVRPSGRPVLLDFGIARALRSAEGRELLEDVALLTAGTAPFMAPEQVQGRGVDARADLYAIGCLLYVLLSGQPPFLGTPAAMLEAHCTAPPPSLAARVAGVPPSVEALARALLAKDPRERPMSAAEVARLLVEAGGQPDPAVRPRPRPHLLHAPLTGRQAEVARLTAGLAQGGLLLLRGPAGAGKTRLALEIGRLAARQRRPVAVAACRLQGPSLQVWRAALAAAGGWLARQAAPPLAPETLAVLAAYLPVEVRRAGLPMLEPVSEVVAGRRRIQATVALLQAWGQASRPVILVDDLPWADDLSLAVFSEVMAVEAPPLTVIATIRQEGETPPAVAALLARHGEISVGPLEEAAVAQLLQERLGLKEPPTRLAAQLHARAEGNPLYVQEFLRGALEAGALDWEPGRGWVLDEGDARTPLTLALPTMPATVREVIRARLQGLSPAAYALVEGAALLGQAAPDAALAALDLPLAGLAEAARTHVLEPSVEGWVFSHGLLRELLLEALPPARRAGLARKAALWAEQAGDSPDRTGHFWLLAGAPERAIPHLEAATQQARARPDLAEAARLLEATAQAQGALGRWRGRLLTLAASVDLWADVGASAHALELAESTVPEAQQRGEAAIAARLLHKVALFSPYIHGAAFALERQRQAVRLEPDPQTRLAMEALAPSLLLALGERTEARQLRLSVEARLPSIVRRADESRALLSLGLATLLEPDVAAAERTYTRLLEIVERPDERELALGNLAIVHYMRGDLLQSVACLDEALSLARRLHKPGSIAMYQGNRAEALLFLGRLAEARDDAAAAARSMRELGQARSALHFLWIWSRAARLLGEPRGPMLSALEQALAGLDAAGTDDATIRPLIELFLLRLAEGTLDAALRAHIDRASAHFPEGDVSTIGMAVQRYRAAVRAWEQGAPLVLGESPDSWSPELAAAVRVEAGHVQP